MMPWPRDREVVERLQKLQREELLAIANHDRDTMVVCRLLWVREYRSGVAGMEPKLAVDKAHMQALSTYDGQQVPGWLLQEKARPLRMVVKREEYYVTVWRDHKVKWYREHLVCGHTFNVMAELFGSAAPRRRRCAQCAREKMECPVNH